MAVILPFLVFLLLTCFSIAAPLTQEVTSFTGPYDAVVVGTNDVIELLPEPTGAPIPVTVLTEADVESCGSQEVCVETRISDYAGHVTTSILQYFNAAPSSVQAAVSGIVGAMEQGISESVASQTATATNNALGPSSLYAAIALVVSDIEGIVPITDAGTKGTTTRAGSTTNPRLSPSSTSQITAAGPTTSAAVRTYATQVTNSQGSTTDEVIAVGSQSGQAYTSVLSEYPDSMTTTVQALSGGGTIQTVTTSTCTTAGALVTTTTAGSTVSTVVPELCTNGFAFLIFAPPDISPGSPSTSLCHRAFSFPAGILWRLLCPPIGPPQISIISVDPSELPPAVGPPGNNPPANSPPRTPEPTQLQTQPQSQDTRTTTNPTSATVSSSSSSSSTSLSAPTVTRYVVMPLLNTSVSDFGAVYASFAKQENVTRFPNTDGSLDSFALELNDTYAAMLDTNNDIIILPESSIDIEEVDSGVTDPDLDGANAMAEAVRGQNVGARDFVDD